MCGWVGVFGKAEPQAALQAAISTVASRGPDGTGERVSRQGPVPAGLAHCRLAIIDPSESGAQPMYDPETGRSIVYNGEVYNAPALRRELIAAGARFRSTSDTEVVLAGWAHWGDAVLDRIEGIFSFALFDERAGRVLLARDRLGVKPLYWARADDAVVAGSSPRALISLRPELGAPLDGVALAQFLTLLWIPHPRTPWAKIHKLPPAHAIVIEGGRVREWCYWEPNQAPGAPPAPNELLDALDGAVRRQLLSDVPVGLLLSGGLDSSLIAALMQRHYQGSGIHAVSAGFTTEAQRYETVVDDLPYARRAAALYPKVDLRSLVLSSSGWADVDVLAPHFDDPVADPAALTMYRLAQASETKVLLSGVGGEELFAGYQRHRALGPARSLSRIPGAARRVIGAAAGRGGGGHPGPAFSTRRRVERFARVTGTSRPLHYWRLMSHLTTAELRALRPSDADAAMEDLDGSSPPLTGLTLGAALAFDRAQFLPNLNLAYVDKAAMAASVEVRVPLCDEAVLAVAQRAESRQLICDGVQKALLKDAARPVLPGEFVDRPKAGFGGPLRAWVQCDATHEFADRLDALADAGLVERGPARAILANAASGSVDCSHAVWAMVCLAAWHDAVGRRRA